MFPKRVKIAASYLLFVRFSFCRSLHSMFNFTTVERGDWVVNFVAFRLGNILKGIAAIQIFSSSFQLDYFAYCNMCLLGFEIVAFL